MHEVMEVFKVLVDCAGHRRISLSKMSLASLILAARYGEPPAHTQTHRYDSVIPLTLVHQSINSILCIFIISFIGYSPYLHSELFGDNWCFDTLRIRVYLYLDGSGP